MSTFPGWRYAILRSLHAPATPENLRFLDAWQRAEGGSARFNPLNTTQGAPGASSYNSVGVRNYGAPGQGVSATVQTLLNGRYGGIVNLLRGGRANALQLARAEAQTPWGTGAGILRVLGSGGATPPRASGGLARAPGGISGAGSNTRSGLSPTVLSVINAGNAMFGLPNLPAIADVRAPRSTPKLPGFHVHGVQTRRDAQAIEVAQRYLGTQYVWGGSSPKTGFDCSGLLQYAWAKQGVKIPRTTYDQFQTGQSVARRDLRPGDAVFFRGSDPKGNLPGHVGMYIGGGKFIEAPGTGKVVRISRLAGHSGYVGARRYG